VDCAWRRQYNQHGSITGLQAVRHSTEAYAVDENYGDDKNVTSYFLEVRQSNLPAIALYEKMGYKNIGIRKKFYEKPVEDAVIMSKNIG